MTDGVVARLFARRAARLAVGILGMTTILAILAPLIANNVPLVARIDGSWRAPILDPAFRTEQVEIEYAVYPPVRHSPNHVSLKDRLRPPGIGHWLGTDELGRDLLARLIHGSRVSLTVGFVAAFIALVVGVMMGAFAGYAGGSADWLVSRLIEVVLCFPFLFLVLGIVALFEPSIWTIILALGLTSWTTEARLVRGEVLRVRRETWAEAAEATGAGRLRILARHLLPNAVAPAIVSAGFGVASAIMVESALSFLGFGVPLPDASWGSILSSANEYLRQAWWIALFPGVAIFGTVISCHVIAERLRDGLDPAMSDRWMRGS